MKEDDLIAELHRKHMYDVADLILEQEAIINTLEYKLDKLEAELDKLGYDVEHETFGLKILRRANDD